jgi:hypothetical protein
MSDRRTSYPVILLAYALPVSFCHLSGSAGGRTPWAGDPSC